MAFETIGLGGLLKFDGNQAIATMGRAGSAFVQLETKANRLPATMARVGASTARAMRQIATASGRNMAAGMSKMAGAARSASMALAPVGLGMAFAAKKAADFEQQMSNTRSILRITTEEMAPLELKAKQLGASTQFTATQAGEAMENMARAGADVGQIIGGIGGIMNAAAADSMGLAEASDVVAKTVKGMGLEWDQANRVADVLANTSSKTNTNISKLGETFRMMAGSARTLGVPLEEAAAVAGKLADAGLDATLGGTSMVNMFNKLAKPSSKGAEMMSKWGIALRDSNNRLLPVSRIVEQFSNRLNKIKDPIKRAGLATELFGLRGQKAFFALQSAGKESLDALVRQNWEAEGAAEEMAKIRLANLKGQLTIFGSAMEGFSIELFQPLLAPLTEFVTVAGKKLGLVVQAIQKIQAAFKRVAKGVGTEADVVQGVIGEFGPVIGNIALGVVDAINIVKGAIASVRAFFVRLSDQAKETFGGETFRSIAKFAVLFAGVAAAAIPVLVGFAGIAFVVSSVVIPAISGLIVFIKGAFLPVLAILGAAYLAFQLLREPHESLMETATRVWGSIKAWALDVYQNAIMPFYQGLRDAFFPVIEELGIIWNETIAMIKLAWQDITASISDGTEGISVDWREVGRTVASVVGAIAAAVLKVVQFLIPIIAMVAPIIYEYMVTPFRVLWQGIKRVIDAFQDMFSGNMVRGLAKLGVAIFDFVLAPIRQLMAAAVKLAETLHIPIPEGIKTFAKEGIGGIVFPEEEKKKTQGVKVVERGLQGVQDTTQESQAKQITNMKKREKGRLARPPKVDVAAKLEDKRQLNIKNCLNVDGREVAVASGRHKQEISERGGFKSTPFQRKMLLEQGAVPVGAGG